MLPILACLCFDGETVTAYDEELALRIACPAPIKGAVRGSTLLAFLTAATKEEAVVEQQKEALSVSCGRSKLNVPTLPVSDFIHSLPADEDFASSNARRELDKAESGKLVKGLRLSHFAMSDDINLPNILGATLCISSKGSLLLFTCNNRVIARYRSKVSGGAKLTCVMAPRFASLLVGIHEADPVQRIELSPDWTQATFESGLVLWAKCVGEDSSDRYQQLYQSVKDEETTELPEALLPAIKRALSVASDDTVTTFAVASRKLRMITDTPLGKVVDVVKLPHADVVFNTVPRLVHEVVSRVEEGRIAFISGRLLLVDTRYCRYLVSGIAVNEETGNG
jgi:DNA polymerase III sliding clamp (beta) subunit (PCNA family)